MNKAGGGGAIVGGRRAGLACAHMCAHALTVLKLARETQKDIDRRQLETALVASTNAWAGDGEDAFKQGARRSHVGVRSVL